VTKLASERAEHTNKVKRDQERFGEMVSKKLSEE
jgi:hypothetical protein